VHIGAVVLIAGDVDVLLQDALVGVAAAPADVVVTSACRGTAVPMVDVEGKVPVWDSVLGAAAIFAAGVVTSVGRGTAVPMVDVEGKVPVRDANVVVFVCTWANVAAM